MELQKKVTDVIANYFGGFGPNHPQYAKAAAAIVEAIEPDLQAAEQRGYRRGYGPTSPPAH